LSDPNGDILKTIICTAANQPFASLALDLILSIRNKPESADIAIGMLDTGLSEGAIEQFRPLVTHLVAPGWDVDFSTLPNSADPPPSAAWLQGSRGYQAMTARPSLPKHFPGYELYIWIDADCWIQEWSVINLLGRGAADGSICISAELDRAYVQYHDTGKITDWTNAVHESFHGREIGARLRNFPILNSGVFALRGDSPLWARWDAVMREGLARKRDFYAEQFGLNRVVYLENFPRNVLPATCNWLANRGLIFFDAATKTFVEPYLPHQPLSIIHLSGESKHKEHRLTVLNGKGVLSTNLRYSAGRKDKPEA
jgi:hypothetical protein